MIIIVQTYNLLFVSLTMKSEYLIKTLTNILEIKCNIYYSRAKIKKSFQVERDVNFNSQMSNPFKPHRNS